MKDDARQDRRAGGGAEADRAAIEAVLTQEVEAWSGCYLHGDRLRSKMMSHELGLGVRRGRPDHSEGMQVHFESEPPEDPRWTKEIEQVEIRGDLAWVICRARTSLDL